MSKCHTILWTNDFCKKLKRAGDAGKPLRVVFSGSHQSQPRNQHGPMKGSAAILFWAGVVVLILGLVYDLISSITKR